MKRLLYVIGLVVWTQGALAEEAEWQAMYACMDMHKADVADVVVSLDEGASLIVEVLCVDESTALTNAMLQARQNVTLNNDTIGQVISSYLFVVKREMRGELYKKKLEQR